MIASSSTQSYSISFVTRFSRSSHVAWLSMRNRCKLTSCAMGGPMRSSRTCPSDAKRSPSSGTLHLIPPPPRIPSYAVASTSTIARMRIRVPIKSVRETVLWRLLVRSQDRHEARSLSCLPYMTRLPGFTRQPLLM